MFHRFAAEIWSSFVDGSILESNVGFRKGCQPRTPWTAFANEEEPDPEADETETPPDAGSSWNYDSIPHNWLRPIVQILKLFLPDASAGDKEDDTKKAVKKQKMWKNDDGIAKIKAVPAKNFDLPDIEWPMFGCRLGRYSTFCCTINEAFKKSKPAKSKIVNCRKEPAYAHPSISIKPEFLQQNPDFAKKIFFYHVTLTDTTSPGKDEQVDQDEDSLLLWDADYPV
jgi:hypothetical protein